MKKTCFFWFRRDLRLDNNAGLYHALKNHEAVLPIFIFDTSILSKLDEPADLRVQFIHQQVQRLKMALQAKGSGLLVRQGKPLEVLQQLLRFNKVSSVYANHDYEPSAIARDLQIQKYCEEKGVEFKTFKDQVVFEKNEILS